MWSTGFQKYLEEILEEFLGEISYQGKRGSTDFKFILSKKEDKVRVQWVEESVALQEELTYEEMYEVVVKNNSLDYLYLFQDVLDELNEPDAKEIMVRPYIKEILQEMSNTFFGRKEEMEVVKEEPKIELIPGVKFFNNGVEYEQLALAF